MPRGIKPFQTGLSLSAKNAIINGDMRIAQRGTSFALAGGTAYTLDRYQYSKTGTLVHTVTQDSSAPNNQFSFSLKLDCTTAQASIGASDYSFIRQQIEGYNFKKFVGQTATLSFWIKAGKTGTMCISFRNSGTDRSYVSEVTINSANTWEYKTITLTFNYSGGTWDYTNGSGLIVTFALAAGSTYQTTKDAWQSGNYMATSNQTNFVDNTDATCDVYITGVQLELGGASPFEFLPFDMEFAQCQRYYQRLGFVSTQEIYYIFYATTAVSYGHSYALPVTMRAAAPATKVGTWTVSNCGQPTAYCYGNSVVTLLTTASAAGRTYFYTADNTCGVTMDAEL